MDYEAVRRDSRRRSRSTATSGWTWPRSQTARCVRLPDDERLQPRRLAACGALFSAGEAASGGAFVGAFAERMGEITPLARTARSHT